MFQNKTLLITGGTGSFGKAVLNRFLKSDIYEIRIFSRDEKKQDDLRKFFNDPKLKFFIGDVRDKDSLNVAMSGVDFVFHAAALKQVPSCEFFPIEAIKTNVLGASNVVDVAINHQIEKVILLSTDKAVYPINAMGMSKALMEKMMFAKSKHCKNTILIGTRYGNVMASRGSVIPLFIDQILEGQDITVTNPNMTRFMMTLEDAVDLVIYAFENGQSGDLFVQKAPASSIETLVKALKELFNADNRVQIIGSRHGEKIYETLVSKEEMASAVDLGDYIKIPTDQRDLNYNKYFSSGDVTLEKIEDYHSHNTNQLNINQMKELLLKLDIVKSKINE